MRRFFLTVSSVIGSGIFLVPYTLSIYGFSGIILFIITVVIFIYLAHILSYRGNSILELLKTTYPPLLVQIICWNYWMVGTLSTLIVLTEITNYSAVFLSWSPILQHAILILLFTILNLFSLKNSMILEITLTIVKIIPLLILPILIFIKLPNSWNLRGWPLSLSPILQSAWGFVGIECGTLIQDNNNKSKSLIYAIALVGFVYLINILSVFYACDNIGNAPYVNVAYNLFGNCGSMLLSLTVVTVCVGTLNSWILSPGLFLYEGAKCNIFPALFCTLNKNQFPYLSVLTSSVVLFLGLIFNQYFSLSAIIDLSTGLFFIFYGAITYAFYKQIGGIFPLLMTIFFLSIGIYTTWIIILVLSIIFLLLRYICNK